MLRVTASDVDSTSNGAITYQLVTGGSSPFTIDASTGFITTTMSLDRENVPQYTVFIHRRARGEVERHSPHQYFHK